MIIIRKALVGLVGHKIPTYTPIYINTLTYTKVHFLAIYKKRERNPNIYIYIFIYLYYYIYQGLSMLGILLCFVGLLGIIRTDYTIPAKRTLSRT